MLKVLIVDDEPPARARLLQILADSAAQLPHEVVGEVDNGLKALEAVDRLRPDVVLLDIAMPVMNGIEAARHLAQRAHPPAIVFVTAHDDRALEAFEVHALDYLLKPVRADRLVATLERVQKLHTHEPRIEQMAKVVGSVRTHITVSERGRMILVPLDEVIYLRAELKYVTIRTREREYLTEESLTALESEFGDRFVRIHRNALVSRAAIEGFQRVKPSEETEGGEGHWEVILRDAPERLPISRRQWASVKATARP